MSYIPYPFYSDDVPIDLSFLFADERPAGRHGFLKACGDKFVFEDGTEGRFWGTNFNGGANFPDFDYSEKVARRLAKIGINIVRFHQLDAEWDTPNIFRFSKGKRCDKTTELDAESMKRLDYLIYCLKEQGIYCYMDMFTYRKFKSGDKVENPFELKDAAKPYCIYNRRLIELQKRLAYDLWTHVNPYTGLAYKDDPVFVMGEVVNECDLFTGAPLEIGIEPYKTEFLNIFKAWLSDRHISYELSECDVNDNTDAVLVDFKTELQKNYFTEIIAFLREIGVKIPFTGTNWLSKPASIKAGLSCDFMDAHFYLYDWHWGDTEKSCMNTAITHNGTSFLAPGSLMRIYGMPLFVSEWDVPWPNECRAESPLYAAAIGALQGWSGYTIHTYAYGTRLNEMKILGKEVSSTRIGGVPYREGIFSTWNDPAKFGLFQHAAIITRRGDVAKGKKRLLIEQPLPHEWKTDVNDAALEISQLGSKLYGEDGYDAELVCEPPTGVDAREFVSDTGELYRSLDKHYGKIDTPRTKCAYGFLGKNGGVELSGMSIVSKTDFAVIAISALDDEPICASKNMLLTTVGRAQNTDCKFDGERMLELGTAPVMIEVIEAELEIETEVSCLRVWAVNAEGFYSGTVAAKYENGKLKFKLGEVSPSMYYLIQAE